MGKLEGKVAIVTGGARGMGASHVHLLAAEGAKVFACDVIEPEPPFTEGSVRFAHLDVTSKKTWGEVVAATEEAFGPVSILVNNAGIFAAGLIEDMDEAVYRRVIDVNQIGTFLGMQAVIPSMRRAGGGSIVNISSTAGLVGHPQIVAYVASKFAVRGMTKVAAQELGPDKIRVNSVHPGGVATVMAAVFPPPDAIPIPRFADPIEVSRMVLFLASDDASYCTGAEFVVDGGFTTLAGQSTL